MKNLWTPWRMEYIRDGQHSGKDCIFESGAGKNSDKKSLLLYRDTLTVVFLNRFPYANGHLLVAPNRHVGDIGDLQQPENTALMEILRESVAILKNISDLTALI